MAEVVNQRGHSMTQNQRRPLTMKLRNQQNFQKYMDKMNEALNKNIEKNVAPYWRNHQSLKGWCSMNYPSILQNPLIKRPQITPQKDTMKFSNQERPISAPNVKIQRPFSSNNYAFKSKALLLKEASQGKLSQWGSQSSGVQLGKSLASYAQAPGSSINTVEKVVSTFPQPKKRQAAKKKEGEGNAKPSSEKPKTTSGLPAVGATNQPINLPQNETNESALKSTTTWNNFKNISKKFSVGTLTTSKYHEKTQVFNQMNELAKDHAAILPQQNYFGQTPDPSKDPFDRRHVKQLDDISFEETDDEEEEDVKNLKRLPQTVLTEETLQKYLGVETQRLNLEHHYWVKDNFLDKIGRMAPNLIELSLRRLRISNKAFTCIMKELRHLERIDIADCEHIYFGGVRTMLENNQGLKYIQASNCRKGVNDEIVQMIANLSEGLSFLDISYATEVTDEGLSSFQEKEFRISKLFVNGLTGISSAGLTDLLGTCKQHLRVFEGALMNQEQMTGAFCQVLACSFELEELDLTGDSNIGDEFMQQLSKGEVKNSDNQAVVVGLKNLKIVKLNGLSKMSDHSLTKLTASSEVLEHLELTRCESLSDYSIGTIIRQTPTLKFIDLNAIPAITPKVLEELKNIKPNLLIRRYLYQTVDPKDNGLRVPRRIVDKKKKKKKKGGKKKKK